MDGDLWNTKWDYEASLLAVAARRLDKHEAPIWEWVPVYGLFSANRAAREFSINILQTYMQLVHADAGLIHVSDPHLINFNKRGLETKSAAQYLNDHFSKLRGFARETALEVLRNTDDAEMPLLNGRDERKLTPNEVWRELVRDIAYEAEEFQVNSDQKLILSHIKDSSVSDTELESLGWGPTRLTSSPITKKHNISKLDPNPWAEKFYTASDHSMPDLETYLARRLGESTFELVRYRNVEPIVFAGSFKALLESGLVNISNLRRVPSPFSTWGIEKFLDSTDESNPRLIFRLPPNLQLARHYEAMLYRAHDLDAMVLDVKGHSELDRGLWLDGDDPIRVYLVESDRKKYEQEFHSLAKKLTQALGNNATVDHIVMGYEYAWRDAIAKDPHWTLSSEETVEANSDTTHLRLRLFKLTSKDDPSITESVLVAGSDKTLWGEGSLYLLQGLIESLPKSPKSVIFLGSAGSPGTNVQYGISFPGYFAGRDKQLIGAYTRNFLVPNSFSTHIWGRSEDGEEFSPSLGDMVNPSGRSSYFAVPKDAPLITLEHGVHGISYSPAEQSREFVEYALTAEFYYQPRVHTVDVETNLIASWLFDYNGNHPNSKIQFGIGHLITDNPASHSRTRETLHSLTEVDRDKKRLAREKLLAETLSRLLDAAKRLRRLAEQPNPAAHE